MSYGGQSKRQAKKGIRKTHKNRPGGIKGFKKSIGKEATLKKSKLLRKIHNWF